MIQLISYVCHDVIISTVFIDMTGQNVNDYNFINL